MARGQAEPPITTRFEMRQLAAGLFQVLQQHQPDRRHRRGEGDFVGVEQFVDRRRRPSWRPGSTSVAPTIGAVKASDQPLAWNIGTTGSTTSRDDRPLQSGSAAMKACSTLERCE